MPKALSPAAIRHYQTEGYYFPVRALDDVETRRCRAYLEAYEASQGGPLSGAFRSKAHLLFKWLDDLIRAPAILDAVEDLIGPDILCWNTLIWTKEAKSARFVSWHQDINYWGLDTKDMVSAWLALSPATRESGCMRVLPGSHTQELLPHADRYHADNMLTRGQEIAVTVDEARAVAMPLQPGEMSLHNVRIAHASDPNCSEDRRIGISIHYTPTATRQLVGTWDSAALVRGVDRYGHFAPTPRVQRDFDPDAVAFHARATDAVREILFTGAERRRDTL